MDNNILLFAGIVISCLVTTIIIFQFVDSRHKRVHSSRNLYILAIVITSIFLMIINLFQKPMLNMASWIIVFGLISYFLYYDDINKPFQRILEVEVMVLVFIVCESIGIVFLDFIFWKMHTPPLETNILSFLNMTFSMVILLFLYYTVIARIWGKKEKVHFTKSQYIMHIIIMLYSFFNLLVIGQVVGRIRSEDESLMILTNMGFIVFADMYFLYFTQFLEKNNYLKTQLKLYEQQASMQYKYYVQQEKRYKQAISVLHDVDKHIRVIEELYTRDNKEEAIQYTREINVLLKPLIPKNWIDNPILNILIDEKIEKAEKLNIDFICDVKMVSLDFMNPMDVTTIFGNLLDNAIEACEKVSDERKIRLKIFPYHDMVAISVENTSKDKGNWKNNLPVSEKGLNHGIGLSNIERALSKYDGSMNLKCESGIFYCNIIINM